MAELIFAPKDREIIEYQDGKQKRSADPLVIEGRLRVSAASRGTSMDRIVAGANAANKPDATEEERAEAYQATEQLCVITAEVFGLKLSPETAEAFGMQTEPGCADMAHCIGVIDAFYRYLEKKNPRADSPPASMPSTASISETQPITNTSSV